MKHEIETRGTHGRGGIHSAAGVAAGKPKGLVGRAGLPVRGGSGAQPAGEPELTPADSLFLCKAVMLNMAALEASDYARFRGTDAGLRKLAMRMLAVLDQIDTECRQLADDYGVPVAEELDGQHEEQLAVLRRLTGAAFSQAYLRKFAMEAPLELIRLCGAQLTDGSAEDLRAAAGKWLQELRNALALARAQHFAPLGCQGA